MVTFLLAGCEAAGNLVDLGDEELDGCRCGLADHLVEVLVSNFSLTILVIAVRDIVAIVAIYLFLISNFTRHSVIIDNVDKKLD